MSLRQSLALTLAAVPCALHAAPVPKEQLLVPPLSADHFVLVSGAGKHGDEWRWALPDGSVAYRESILLRGLVFEDDALVRYGADGLPTAITVRGVQPSGDVAEQFEVANGAATWVSPVDKGSAVTSHGGFYVTQGGPFLSSDHQYEKIVAAGTAGLPLLPSGVAHAEKWRELSIMGPAGAKTISLWAVTGINQAPSPAWFDANGKFLAIIYLANTSTDVGYGQT